MLTENDKLSAKYGTIDWINFLVALWIDMVHWKTKK